MPSERERPARLTESLSGELAAALSGEAPAEQLAILERAIARVSRRRSILLWGYVLALIAMIGGMLGSLYVYGSSPPGKFVGWVFFIPVSAVGAILWGFGRWAKQV